MARRRLHLSALVCSAVTGALLLTGLTVAPAGAAPLPSPTPAPTDCPAPLPTAQAVEGLSGRGFTVEKGTRADAFSATVLGRITDGISPGVDMIVAELGGPAVDRAGGVWAGMSGSPVYAEDGRLVGAVAYGLSFGPSPVAGLTPAASMYGLLGSSAPKASAPASAGTVRPSGALAATIDSETAVTTSQARTGFRLLTLPVRTNVGVGKSSKALLDRLQKSSAGTTYLTGGGRVTSAAGDPQAITAGSNFAAALSVGDVTFAGTGTTTAVCNGVALAFGHPFLEAGRTQMSAHGASAVLVQRDPVFGPFKVANPGPVVGTVTRDARVGIAGPLGKLPASVPVSASFRDAAGVLHTGSSRVMTPDITADVAAFQTVATLDKLYGGSSAGTVRLTISVDVKRRDGRVQTVRRSDAVASRSAVTGWPVAYAAADEVYALVSELTDQTLEDVSVTGVRVTGAAETAYRASSVTGSEWRQQYSYRPVADGTQLRAGQTLYLRNRLSTTGSTATTVTRHTYAVSRSGFLGVDATLEVVPGSEARYYLEERSPRTYDELVSQVRARPAHASVTTVLSYVDNEGRFRQAVSTQRTTHPVVGRPRGYEVFFG